MGSDRSAGNSTTEQRSNLKGKKRRMKFASAACVILLHLSLLPLCQATVSECLTCVATSSMNDAAADACRAGDAATVPKVACVDWWNHNMDALLLPGIKLPGRRSHRCARPGI